MVVTLVSAYESISAVYFKHRGLLLCPSQSQGRGKQDSQMGKENENTSSLGKQVGEDE